MLAIVQKRDLERKLNLFLLDRKTDHKIPGWQRFAALVGDSGDSRALFVSMYQQETFLMQMAESRPAELSPALAKRVDVIRGNSRYNYNQLSLGTIAAMFFLSAQPQVSIEPQVASNIGGVGKLLCLS